jgi:radical SAM protein with 4Fe4S-binding SPASM domain
MLVMTEFCNLKCDYCFEHQASKRVLTLETAQTVITEAFQNSEFDELEISFFGGEPFAAFRRIQEICEWIWSCQWSKPYICFATTNGTLVHGKVQDWLKQHKKKFVVGLSLDGTAEMHNANRDNSFSKIDLDFFKEQWPFQPVKMTISPKTIGHVSEGIKFIHSQGFKLTANTAFGVDWEPSHFDAFASELKKLADFYLDNPDIEPCQILDMRIDISSGKKYREKEGLKSETPNYCGTGISMSAIDLNGNRYPCQTFMPMTTGQQDDVNEILTLINTQDNRVDEKCQECAIIDACQTCYGLNYADTGSPFLRNINDCKFQKLRAKATAYLWAGMIKNREKNYNYLASKDETELYHIIKGIELVTKEVRL